MVIFVCVETSEYDYPLKQFHLQDEAIYQYTCKNFISDIQFQYSSC